MWPKGSKAWRNLPPDHLAGLRMTVVDQVAADVPATAEDLMDVVVQETAGDPAEEEDPTNAETLVAADVPEVAVEVAPGDAGARPVSARDVEAANQVAVAGDATVSRSNPHAQCRNSYSSHFRMY